jgi:hypothetical protein
MYAKNLKIGKPNNLKFYGSNKTKGHKQDSQSLSTEIYLCSKLTIMINQLRGALYSLMNF